MQQQRIAFALIEATALPTLYRVRVNDAEADEAGLGDTLSDVRGDALAALDRVIADATTERERLEHATASDIEEWSGDIWSLLQGQQ